MDTLDTTCSALAQDYMDTVFFRVPACKMFVVLPMWVSEGFQTPHKHQVNLMLGQANLYLTLYLHLQDDSIDQPDRTDPYLLLLGTLFFIQLTELYQNLFSCSSRIWATFKEVFASYARATLHERQYTFDNLGQVDVNTDIDVSLMGQKFSPLKLCCHAHALLSRSEEKVHALSEMIDHYGTALQLHNDLVDWREDLERGQLSYPALLLLREYRKLSGKSPTLRGMQMLMANSPVVGNVLRNEITFLEKARAAIEGINLPSLQQYLVSLINALQRDLPMAGNSLFDLLELGNESSHYASK